MKHIPRTPVRTTDQFGRRIVRVPLAKEKGDAIVNEDDYDKLMELGLSSQWFANGRGPGYVRAALNDAPGSLVSIGRIIMAAGDGRRVHYRDRNPLNLRRGNLRASRGYALRCDAAILIQNRLEKRARDAERNAPAE